jgi:hypothetical protein
VHANRSRLLGTHLEMEATGTCGSTAHVERKYSESFTRVTSSYQILVLYMCVQSRIIIFQKQTNAEKSRLSCRQFETLRVSHTDSATSNSDFSDGLKMRLPNSYSVFRTNRSSELMLRPCNLLGKLVVIYLLKNEPARATDSLLLCVETSCI